MSDIENAGAERRAIVAKAAELGYIPRDMVDTITVVTWAAGIDDLPMPVDPGSYSAHQHWNSISPTPVEEDPYAVTQFWHSLRVAVAKSVLMTCFNLKAAVRFYMMTETSCPAWVVQYLDSVRLWNEHLSDILRCFEIDDYLLVVRRDELDSLAKTF